MLRSQEHNWYAIYTRCRFEKKIYSRIQKLGIEAFLPLIKEERVWSDRVKTVEIPLLPSYVFVRTIDSELSNLYYIPGFVRIVSFEGKPYKINEKDIELIKTIIVGGIPIEHTNRCTKGDRVKVVRGPLKDWEGYVQEIKRQSRITFYFDGIDQFLSVEIAMQDVEIIRRRATA